MIFSVHSTLVIVRDKEYIYKNRQGHDKQSIISHIALLNDEW